MFRLYRYGLGIGALLALGAVAQAQISDTGTASIGPFTQAQVDTGRGAYDAACARCHGRNLSDGTHRTPLTGGPFMIGWGWRSVGDYLRYIRTRMPYREPNTLSPDTYAAITAYILAANGAQPGTEVLTEDSAARISTIADGEIREPVLAGNP